MEMSPSSLYNMHSQSSQRTMPLCLDFLLPIHTEHIKVKMLIIAGVRNTNQTGACSEFVRDYFQRWIYNE